MIFNRMFCFIEQHRMLAKQLFGFQEKHSCVHAVIQKTNYQRKIVENEEYVLSLFFFTEKSLLLWKFWGTFQPFLNGLSF